MSSSGALEANYCKSPVRKTTIAKLLVVKHQNLEGYNREAVGQMIRKYMISNIHVIRNRA